MKTKSFFITTFLMTGLLLLPNIGSAYLNEQTSSHLKSKRASHYKQVVINESADNDGVIRKVSWSGPHHPNLKTLMGPCYSYYRDYMKQNKRQRMRGAVTIEQGGCHINIGGHMRNIQGEVSLDK
jgi:hypothetical protein